MLRAGAAVEVLKRFRYSTTPSANCFRTVSDRSSPPAFDFWASPRRDVSMERQPGTSASSSQPARVANIPSGPGELTLPFSRIGALGRGAEVALEAPFAAIILHPCPLRTIHVQL